MYWKHRWLISYLYFPEHEIELQNKSLNYSNGLMQAAEDYDRDIKLLPPLIRVKIVCS